MSIPSKVVGVGNYSGGNLWYYDPYKGKIPHKVTERLYGFPSFQIGDVVKGSSTSIKYKFFSFDGNNPHATLPFSGERMTMVYFSHGCWTRAADDSALRLNLRKLGFKLPSYQYCGRCVGTALPIAKAYGDQIPHVRQGLSGSAKSSGRPTLLNGE